MNLVFVFPFCSPEVNSISGGPIYIGSAGHKVLVITARHSRSLKGDVSAPLQEKMAETEFYRPYEETGDLLKRPELCWAEVREKVAAFGADAVIGFGEFNYRLPVRISREFSLPYVLYMEYLRPEKIGFPMRGRTALKKAAPVLHDWLSGIFMRYLTRQVSAIMYAYYADAAYAEKLQQRGIPAHYVPWCTDVGLKKCPPGRKRNSGIYIGSIDAFKNAAELVRAIPLILDHTETEHFTVVGPGEYAPEIMRLVDRYGDRLRYIESVPREEALRLICASGYGYTPVRDCGLGFIGDCWGTGTPLVATHDLDGFLNPDSDALIAHGCEDLSAVINKLLGSEDVYESLKRNGLARYGADYTAESAGERYLGIVSSVADDK